MSLFLSTLTLLPVVWYVVQFERWRWIWSKTPDFEPAKLTDAGISVIVPFRNEASNLKPIVQAFSHQVHPCFEVIFVDDHSTDDSIIVLREELSKASFEATVINNSGTGKKAALATGIARAKHELIVTTDADCVFSPNWLLLMAASMQENNWDLCLAPVSVLQNDHRVSDFEFTEFAALQMTGAAAALSGRPIMVNGANLACKKQIWIDADLKPEIASGDDMFLLEHVKNKGGNIGYLKASEAIVYTQGASTWNELFQQRARWAGKATNYRDAHILLNGAMVALTNITQLGLLVATAWNQQFGLLFLLFLVLRLLADVRLLQAGQWFFGQAVCIRQLLVYQLLYPVYMLAVLVFPLVKKVRWKDRPL